MANTNTTKDEDDKPTPTDETLFTHPPLTPNTPLHHSLSTLDLSLRCTICYNLLTVPVSLYPCLHTFCSICVRKNLKRQYVGMKRKAECPTCNVNLLSGSSSGGGYEKAILPNRQLESVVDLYREGVRGELRRSLVRLDELERREELRRQLEDNGGGDEEKKEEEQKIAAVSSSKRARRSTANYKREYSSDREDVTMTLDATNDGSSSSAATASTGDASTLPAVAVAASSINNPQRKRKPPISYHNLKRPKLIKLLQAENLPTNGTDSELQQRHSEYIMLYNSQCDSQHPMSERDVIATILKEEKMKKREAREAMRSGAAQHEGYMKRLAESVERRNNQDGGGGSENTIVVTTGSKRLDGEMKNNFKDLIEKVKARKRGDVTTTSTSSSTNDDGDNVPSCIAAAAAAATAASVVDGNNNFASKPRAKSSDTAASASSSSVVAVSGNNNITSAAATTVVGATTMKAATTASIRTTTTTTARQKSISSNIQKPKSTTTTPSKSRTTIKKQATLSSSSSSAVKKKSSAGIWKCPTCTFENHKYITATAICEMCNTPRPEKENTSNEFISIDC